MSQPFRRKKKFPSLNLPRQDHYSAGYPEEGTTKGRIQALPLPLDNVTNLLDRGKELGKVLWCAGAPGGCRANLQLPQAVLQLVDGLTECKLVPHLLYGVHIA